MVQVIPRGYLIGQGSDQGPEFPCFVNDVGDVDVLGTRFARLE